MARVLGSCAHPEWPLFEASLREAVLATLAGVILPGEAEVGILLTDDGEIQRLNRQYRGIDRATNVLSFPLESLEGVLAGKPKQAHARADAVPLLPLLLGDVVLAYETVTTEADERGISLEQHTVHLLVHGLLHLLGYDHERSPEAAKEQESREIAILARLGWEDPYG